MIYNKDHNLINVKLYAVNNILASLGGINKPTTWLEHFIFMTVFVGGGAKLVKMDILTGSAKNGYKLG